MADVCVWGREDVYQIIFPLLLVCMYVCMSVSMCILFTCHPLPISPFFFISYVQHFRIIYKTSVPTDLVTPAVLDGKDKSAETL